MRAPRGVTAFIVTMLLLQSVLTACTSHVRQPVGEISRVRGNVFLGRDGLPRPRLLTLHEPIYPDDVLVSEGASEAILLVENLRLTLGADTHLSIGTSSWFRLAVALEHGTIRAIVESADALFRRSVEVHLDGDMVVRTRSNTLLWSQEQPDGLGPQAAGLIVSFGVVNLGRVRSVELDVDGRSLPIMPQHFSVGVPGHSPTPAVPLSVASSAFRATIYQGLAKPDKSGIKRPTKGVHRHAKQHCKRDEAKMGIIKTPRRHGYEDSAKCL